MNKEEVEQKLIESYGKLFTDYPDLKILPVYAWGRYYKYECSGDKYEYSLEDMEQFPVDGIEDKVDEVLLEIIENEIINSEDYDEYYIPNRKNCVDIYDFDDRGAMTLVLVKGESGIKVECWESDTAE